MSLDCIYNWSQLLKVVLMKQNTVIIVHNEEYDIWVMFVSVNCLLIQYIMAM